MAMLECIGGRDVPFENVFSHRTIPLSLYGPPFMLKVTAATPTGHVEEYTYRKTFDTKSEADKFMERVYKRG